MATQVQSLDVNLVNRLENFLMIQIGDVQLDNPTVFAPLAGITNLPMRLLAKEYGCALVYTEMISANALVYGAAKTRQMLASVPEERPVAVQLFGSDPGMMAEAAQYVESSGADIIDINFGCAVKKILKSGSGVALMADLKKAEALIKAVRNAIKVPLTIKIRSGWHSSGDDALTLAAIAQNCGVNAIAVHPRTAKQGFTGHADWQLIGKIKNTIDIPVIGNGDIQSAQDAQQMIDQTGCDAVMVGRAAMGNPFIFRQICDHLAGNPLQPVTYTQRFDVMARFIEATSDYLGEKTACFILRSRLGWFAKGLPQASRFRKSICRLSSKQEAHELLQVYKDSVMAYCED